MSFDVKSNVHTLIKPAAATVVLVQLDADVRRSLSGKLVTFEPTLGRLKSKGELLVLDVEAGSVTVTNRNTREIIIKPGQTLGRVFLVSKETDVPLASTTTAWPTIQDAASQTCRNNRVSKAIPIVAPPTKAVPILATPSKAIPTVAPPPQAPPLTTEQKQAADSVNNKPQSMVNSNHTAQETTQHSSSSSSSTPIPTPPLDNDSSDLDVYARPYIPEALRNINKLPAHQIVAKTLQRIDYARYTSSFAGNSFVSEPLPAKVWPMLDCTRIDNMFPDQLTVQNYATYWNSAIGAEIAARKETNDNIALFNVPIEYDLQRNVLSLTVPGLSEGNLHVEVGDQVILRQLRVLQQLHTIQYGKMYQTGPIMAFTGFEHVVNVVGIFRQQELLELCPEGRLVQESMRFNVRFTGHERREEALRSTLSHANQAMNMAESWLSKMTFPTQDQCILQTQLNRASFSITPIDTNLNTEQLRAVQSITQHNYGDLPFLIDGPPGTGKTKTLVEAILQLVHQSDQNKIFVCAPSDPAADTLATRLSKHLAPGQLLRLNDAYRTFQEVPEKLLMFCCINDERFSLPSFKDLMKCQVVVTTCRDAHMLVQARVTNADLAELEHGLLSSLHPKDAQQAIRLHWTSLVIDEAAQATELEALIPLSVLNPPSAIPFEASPTVVMAGDPKQLIPRTASKSLAIETSLFARLLDRDVYRLHPLARSNIRGYTSSLTQTMLPMTRPPFATLIRNYRSHPAILAVPSALFYNDTLIPEASDTKMLLSIPDLWRGRGWPVLFCQNDGSDEISREGGGWYNVTEAHKALQYARKLLQSGKVAEKDIAIVSPFEANVKLLRNLARSAQYKLWSVNVSICHAVSFLPSFFPSSPYHYPNAPTDHSPRSAHSKPSKVSNPPS